jgi:Asp-tRNA(Asn)/Glu-tRNA(Gln) amidotransferase A subunit family amidase
MSNLNKLSATEAAAAIAAKRVKSVDLVAACLDRIKAREPEIGAWSFIDPVRAMDEARARDAEAPRGPLHGVPTSSIPPTCRRPTARRSTRATGHRSTRRAWH